MESLYCLRAFFTPSGPWILMRLTIIQKKKREMVWNWTCSRSTRCVGTKKSGCVWNFLTMADKGCSVKFLKMSRCNLSLQKTSGLWRKFIQKSMRNWRMPNRFFFILVQLVVVFGSIWLINFSLIKLVVVSHNLQIRSDSKVVHILFSA